MSMRIARTFQIATLPLDLGSEMQERTWYVIQLALHHPMIALFHSTLGPRF